MSNRISFNPNIAVDSNHAVAAGAKAYFYDTGTTNAQTVYSDTSLSVAVSQPLIADSSGVFATTYTTNSVALKIVVTDSADVTLYTIDPVVVQASSSSAEDISVTPFSTIAATDVQAALEEVHSEAAASDVSSDTSPQLGGTLDTNSQQIRWSKGADVASATNTVVGSDGNYFDITGTTTIATIGTQAVGTVICLHFDGALTLTHHSTNLILPGGANITTAAGDEAIFVEYASADWRCISYTKANGKAVVESVTTDASGWEFVEDLTVSGTAAETSAFVSGYSYKIVMTEVKHNSGTRYFYFRVREDDDTYHTLATDDISGGTMSTTQCLNGRLTLDNPQESADIHLIEVMTSVNTAAIGGSDALDPAAGGSQGFASVGFASASTIKAISIEPSGGNISGAIRVYRRPVTTS